MHPVGPPHLGTPNGVQVFIGKKKTPTYKWTCIIRTRVVQGQFYIKNQVKNQLLRTFTNLRLHLDKCLYSYRLNEFYTPNYKTKKVTIDLGVLMNATRNDLKYMIYFYISNLKFQLLIIWKMKFPVQKVKDGIGNLLCSIQRNVQEKDEFLK